MSDVASRFDFSIPPSMQRARGAVRLEVGLTEGATALARLRQEGCLKLRFPRPEPGAWMSAVLVNSSGGVAAGDVLAIEATAGAGCQLTLAGQAAERIYRALPGAAPADITTRLRLAAGAAMEWLPQETILFDQAALHRTLDIDMAADSTLVAVETLVFGRALMGEQVREARLHDLIRLRRGGRLVLHDAIRLDGAVASLLSRRAVAAGHHVVATLIHAAPDAATRLDALRAALAGVAGVEAGASAWDGVLLARLVASDSACARHAVLAGLACLRDHRPVPRVWLC
jgi:urease accessory protein